MNLDTANEADVREEIAMPLLSALGYLRGSENDIRRELSLRRPYDSLGRRKNSDPPLRGKADYVLVITGVGRWVLEVKAPNVEIGIDEIEQTISYARHPEVSGTYAAILNGRHFVLFHNSQHSEDKPILSLEISDVESLRDQLEGTLSPAAIRRDLRPPIVDVNLPIAPGLRSHAIIAGGTLVSAEADFSCNLPIKQMHDALAEACRTLNGRRFNVNSGAVWRDGDSLIKAKMVWDAPHEEVLRFMREKQLNMVEYVALSDQISTREANPTIFDVIGNLSVTRGDRLFDVHRWQSVIAGTPLNMSYHGQGEGHLDGNTFCGDYYARYGCKLPQIPQLEIEFVITGTFDVKLDTR